MSKEVNKTLKDWSIVVFALGKGDQVFLNRRGSQSFISSKIGVPTIVHPEFFLYPTFQMKNKKKIKKNFHGIFFILGLVFTISRRIFFPKSNHDNLPH